MSGRYPNNFTVLASVLKLHLRRVTVAALCHRRHRRKRTFMQTTIEHASQAISAERRLQELGIHLPVPPEPFGTYTEAVQVGPFSF